MTDTDLMKFGKHKNEMMGKIPAQYLLWLYDNLTHTNPYTLELKSYIEDNMDVLKSEISNSKSFYNDRL